MDDALTMGFGESIGDLNAGAQDFIERHGGTLEAGGESLAFDEFHDQVVVAILLADIMQGADVGMVEAGNGAGFAHETFAIFGFPGKMIGEDFDGDGAVKAGVAGAVDFAHAAGAEGGGDLVGTEFGSGGQRHRLGGIIQRECGINSQGRSS